MIVSEHDDYILPPAGDEPDTGKTLSALQRSRKGHNAMIALFGADMLPSSIMRTKRVLADAGRDEHAAERNFVASLPDYNKRGLADPKLPQSIKGMHRMNSGSLTGALSKFPQDVARTVVLFYSEPGDTVVDPFAGHNSRMDLCIRAGRDYIGCDLSAPFMEFNRKRAEQLRQEFPNRKIKLHETDSRDQPIPDSVGDFTITSPPYWNREWYGPEPEQLGMCATYEAFLDGMKLCIAENHRTLKADAFSVWFVNDFRDKGRMFFYHADILRLGQEVGFVAHDIIVVDLGRGLRDGFVNEAVRCKVIPKRHEYAVVFKKPGDSG